MPRREKFRYRPMSLKFRNEPGFRALSGPATFLWYELFFHPGLTPLGCMRATLEGLAAEMESKMRPMLPQRSVERYPQGFTEVVEELSAAGELGLDRGAHFVALRRFFEICEPQNPNGVKGLFSAHDHIPQCELLFQHLQTLRSWCEKRGATFLEAFDTTLPPTFQQGFADLGRNQDSGFRIQDSGIAAVARAREGFLPSIRRAWLDVVNRPLASTDPDRIDRWQADGVDPDRAVFVIEWLGARATIAGDAIHSLAYFEPALEPGADPQPIRAEDKEPLLAASRAWVDRVLTGDLHEACVLILEKRPTAAVAWGVREGLQRLERRGEATRP